MIKVKWIDNTSKVLAELQRKGLQYVSEGGQIIRTEMSTRCPVDKGNLRNSIQVETYFEDGKPTSETGPTADYAPYVEYGTGIHASPEGGGSHAKKIPWFYKDEEGNWHKTSGMKAQPFAEPGFQAAKPQIDRIAERILRV
jgi:HK97 gp10 family phage protein